MTIFQAILLGIVQGLTEFVPVSSSAHLIIVPWLFGWNEPNLAFDIALHLGTLTALIWFFAADLKRLIRAFFASLSERRIGDIPERRLAWFLIIASIPGCIAGFFGENQINQLFHQPGVPISPLAMVAMAGIIILLGLILFIIERTALHRKSLSGMSIKDAVIIGLSQSFSIFPGVSRSGSTFTGALSTGLKRDDAARFSFLLAIPIVAGAGLNSLYEIFSGIKSGAISSSEILIFVVGFLVAAITGYLCIKFLLRFLQKNSTDAFVYYRWGLAALIIVVVLIRA